MQRSVRIFAGAALAAAVLFSIPTLALAQRPAVCNCQGYSGPGGVCYAGPGGPAYKGPGGACYSGPGGPCYSGPGGGRACPVVCSQ